MESYLIEQLEAHNGVVEALKTQSPQIAAAISLCVTALGSGKKIMLCGNGGSAADAQHIAAELIPIQVAALKEASAFSFSTGMALASTGRPEVLTEMYPPAC